MAICWEQEQGTGAGPIHPAAAKGKESASQSAYRGILQYFSEENFEKLSGIMYPKKAEAGTYLFWEGEEAEKLYYLRSGQVKLRKSTEDGRELLLSVMQKGDLIGDIGGCGETQYTFSAEVSENADIGVILRKDLEILIYRHGEFAMQFTQWMGIMNRITQSKFRDLLLYGKTGALASTLIRTANSFGVMVPDGIRLDIKLNNTELAEMIGATRESVNRMLSDLKRDKTIDQVNGKIVIRRLEALRLMSSCPKFPACPKEICRL